MKVWYDNRIEAGLSISDLTKLKAKQLAAHEERMRIINKPFPPIMPGRRVASALPWSGLILGDRFFGDGEPSGRRAPRVRTEGDLYGGDYHYGPGVDL